MKLTILMLAAITLPTAAATISPADASKHIGETVTVEGLASVYQARSGVTFVDLGGAGRNAAFTGVIFRDKAGAFPNVTSYSGKTVNVTGPVKLYNGKPEITLERADQLSAH